MHPKQILPVLFCGVLSTTAMIKVATAQPPTLVSLTFPPTDDSRGGTSRSEGGGHRGPACVRPGATPLMPLLPNRATRAQTVDPTPALYWYIPPTPAQTAEFMLTDHQGEVWYMTTVDLPKQPGVVKLTLPQAAALEKGSTYQWTFSLLCDEEEPSRNTYVSGSIERTTLSASALTQLQTSDPLQQAQVFAQSKIWHDTLDRVAQIRPQRQSEWEELLTSVGLSVIAQEPFQDCCTTE